MSRPQFSGKLPHKRQFLRSDGEITAVENLGSDVHPVFQLEVNEIGLPVFDFVESGFLASAAFDIDRKSTRLNSSHRTISYAVFCLKKKKKKKKKKFTLKKK